MWLIALWDLFLSIHTYFCLRAYFLFFSVYSILFKANIIFVSSSEKYFQIFSNKFFDRHQPRRQNFIMQLSLGVIQCNLLMIDMNRFLNYGQDCSKNCKMFFSIYLINSTVVLSLLLFVKSKLNYHHHHFLLH